MVLPKLTPSAVTEQTVTRFGGYDHRESIAEGDFYDMQNLSPCRFPCLSPRLPQSQVFLTPSFVGKNLIGKNRLWYTWGNQLQGFDPVSKDTWYIHEAQPGGLLVSFGALLVDMEHCRWWSTIPNASGEFDQGTFGYDLQGSAKGFSAYICEQDGTPIEGITVGTQPPETPADRDLWLDIGGEKAVLYQYFLLNEGWFPAEYWVRVSAPMDECPAVAGDVVEATFPTVSVSGGKTAGLILSDDQLATVTAVGENPNGTPYLVLACSMAGTSGFSIAQDGTVRLEETVGGTVTLQDDTYRIANPIPIMDFVFEGGNRLWGCRYGVDRKGNFVNEIYASALGAFRVWHKFDGVASDSYRVSCGTDGPFTGGICFEGNPLFFKEQWLHKVYGTFPFQVTPIACQGVKLGSHNSLAVVGNVLYYHGRAGICAFTGSLPTLIKLPFGEKNYHNVCAAATADRYYFLAKGEGETPLFVYHTGHGLLYKEDAEGLEELCSFGGEVYALASVVTAGQYKRGILCLTSPTVGTPLEDKVSWWGQSGKLTLTMPGHKYVTELALRLSLAEGSQLQVWIRYDEGEFQKLYELNGPLSDTAPLPIRVQRCDTATLRLAGQGQATVYSLTKRIEREG